MAEQRVLRRLAAILASDVVGYSRLMGEDETGTLAALMDVRADLVDPLIAEHHGRVVKLMGDGTLVEFSSAVDAVECALHIQSGLSERANLRPESARIALRIGINLGDVIIDGDDIYGDGVNVASRLESIAEPGGTVVSGMVYEIIRGKVACDFDDLGNQQVKNIAVPIRAFQIRHAAAAGKHSPSPTASSGAARSTGDGPSIVVLPFRNTGGDPGQDYFADGISEDLITDLSKIEGLYVVGRNSSFAFKGGQIAPKDIARQLGVRHLLTGSVRPSGDRVRINAELSEPETGLQLWADRFDGNLADIFELQDDITSRIINSLKPHLTGVGNLDGKASASINPEAYDLCLRGRSEFYLYTPDHLDKAKSFFESAIEIDASYAEAYAYLSYCHCAQYVFAWPGCDETLEPAVALAQKAISLDDRSAVAYGRLGWILGFLNRPEETISTFEKAITLNPRIPEVLYAYGETMNRLGEPQRALPLLEKAFSIDTFVPPAWEFAKGHSFNLLGRFEEAIREIVPVLERVPGFVPGRVQLTRAYHELGRDSEARANVDTLKKVAPNYSVRSAGRMFPYPDVADRDRLADALRSAGLQN